MATSREIEREVESNRAQVESTLDELKQKMSVGQIVDELGRYLGAEDAKAAVRNVGRQVRENPIALGLVGVGLAWLVFGGRANYARPGDGVDRRSELERRRYPAASAGEAASIPERDADYAVPGTGGAPHGSGFEDRGQRDGSERGHGHGEGIASRAAHAVGDAVSGVRHVVSRAGEAVSSAVRGAGAGAQSWGHAGSERLHEIREGAGRYVPERRALSDRGSEMSHAVAEAVERQPLLAGAVAAAIGAALGAAFPATRTEDRWLGDSRDEAIDQARRAARDLGRQAKEAAKAGVDAAAEAAREEGLIPEPGGKTLADKVEHVVRAGAEEAREAFADKAEAAEEGRTEPTGGGRL